MTKFTIVSGYCMDAVAEVDAPNALAAAVLGHQQALRDDKRSADGFSYEEHSADWGKAGAQTRRDGSGNGAQSLDDCYLVCEGEYPERHEFTRDDAVSIVRAIPPGEF